jgi:hypothetical protein
MDMPAPATLSDAAGSVVLSVSDSVSSPALPSILSPAVKVVAVATIVSLPLVPRT